MMKKGDRSLFDRIEGALNELAIDPFIPRPELDIRLISSRKMGIYRIWVGRYRILYQVKNKEKQVIITALFKRGRGYRGIH